MIITHKNIITPEPNINNDLLLVTVKLYAKYQVNIFSSMTIMMWKMSYCIFLISFGFNKYLQTRKKGEIIICRTEGMTGGSTEKQTNRVETECLPQLCC